jgi:MarR family transcriptional regulator, organic hydroperoxide resistance regulator
MALERLVEDLLSLSRLLRFRRGSGMTPQQYWLLRQLREDGPLSIGELAKALGITTGSATVACKRLEKAGLLTRERQVEDERIVQVALTGQGRAQVEALRQRRREELEQWLSVLDQREQEDLRDMVERLLEAAAAQDSSSPTWQEEERSNSSPDQKKDN